MIAEAVHRATPIATTGSSEAKISARQPLAATELKLLGATLTVIWSPDTRIVYAAGFAHTVELADRMQRLSTGPVRLVSSDDLWLREQAAAYCDADRGAFAAVRYEQPSTPFLTSCRDALTRIPYGQTRSYAQLAADAGKPLAVRAAASACARNLIAVIVPCHRVCRSDGSLGGYAYGQEIKSLLLRHEATA